MRKFQETHFNDLHFNNFIPGHSNIAAIRKAVDFFSKGKAGLLFICGPCGGGKTHLVGAIGNKFLEYKSNAHIHVINFITEKNWALPPECMLLIVEDIGPLVLGDSDWHRDRLQKLINLVRQCMNHGVTTILTSDSSPIILVKMPRAITCFLAPSSILEIGLPNRRHRMKMAKMFSGKLAEEWFQIPHEVINQIVLHEETPRAVESKLYQMKCLAELSREKALAL